MSDHTPQPYADATRHVDAMPDGAKIGALFDFDGTLVSGYSAALFLREQLRRGHLSPTDLVELGATITNLAMGRIALPQGLLASARIFRGVSERSYEQFGQEVFDQQLTKRIFPEARALVRAHLRKKHTVIIVSSATIYQLRPAARSLGIEHVLCTRMEVANGRFTGRLTGVACWGAAKVTAVEQFCAAHKIDLRKSVFYSDSYDDLPLLERVGEPRVLNPDAKLRAIALDREWPLQHFHSRDSVGVSAYLRALGVYGSLVGSAAIGLGVWGLSGSKSDGRNSMISLWADVASSLIGLKLEVIGEEKLWANRPAVIITNHQSQADAIIVMKLLRGNFVAVGKKEITRIPLVSQAIQFAGVIPIDRQDAAKAIESMQPLLHAIQSEKRFAVVAVEGTRSTSTTPGAFKKGAFHIAMEAGVPIIPVVIHNGIDAQPRGDFVFRPATVCVEVLDPIDVSKWKVEDLDRHIAEVRDLYLRKLGIAEEAAAANTPVRPRVQHANKRTRKRGVAAP
jgi:putative phosphoserine phosphatase/1-acylglycerol-3-phosphate O-acyltransferase